MPRSPANALARLKAGNQRYVAGRHSTESDATPLRRHELVSEQQPYAIILGCSDSRVPAEMVFDQGLGSLFVIRVAGNIVAPSHIASAEYAATALGTHLIVVLGHTGCGAVKAALSELERPTEDRNPGSAPSPTASALLSRTSSTPTSRLRRGWSVPFRSTSTPRFTPCATAPRSSRPLIEKGELVVVGAEYNLESGVVEFFDDALPPV